MKALTQVLLAWMVVSAANAASAELDGIFGTANTVWVPSLYREDGRNALYVQGQAVNVHGYTDVAGFQPNDKGYLVAVYQSTQHQAGAVVRNPGYGKVVGFYQLSHDGKLVSQVGVIDGVVDVIVSETAVYAKRMAGDKLYDWVGYDLTGASVSGPNGAIYATPLADDAWYVVRWENRRKNETITTRETRNGQGTLLRNAFDVREVSILTNSTGIAVDQANVADSVRTGYALRTYREANRTSRDFATWKACAVDLSYAVRAKGFSTKLGRWCTNLGESSELSRDQAVALTKRLPLVRTGNAVKVATQYSKGGPFSALNYGLINLSAKDPYASKELLYTMLKGGLNGLRSVFGSNTTEVSANSENDGYLVVAPTGQYLISANKSLEQPQVFDLSQNVTIGYSQIVLTQFGVVR